MAKNTKYDAGMVSQKADLTVRDYGVLIGLLVLLVACWFLIPIIFKGLVEIGKFATYVVACFSVTLAAYATLSTYRLKMADVQRARQAALAAISSDTEEILQESADFGSRLQAVQNGRHDKWNLIIEDFKVLERRYERKQDQLAFLSMQFPSSVFPKIQGLYLEMLKLCMCIGKYLVREPLLSNPDAAGRALEDNRKEVLKHLRSSEDSIGNRYVELKRDVRDLRCLATKAMSGDAKS